MIQQHVGDFLEILYADAYSYAVVLSKIVMFGGNIVFAFHSDGGKHQIQELSSSDAGFNICTDLLLPKRNGQVTQIHHFETLSNFGVPNSPRALMSIGGESQLRSGLFIKLANLAGSTIQE
jgi:hypothetical protein